MQFGTLIESLNAAGVKTRTSRGFWGGVTSDHKIVVTAWSDGPREDGGFIISRPRTNHGKLKEAWDSGRIQPGATVRLIVIRQSGQVPWGRKGRIVKDAALLPGQWRVVRVFDEGDMKRAIVKPEDVHR